MTSLMFAEKFTICAVAPKFLRWAVHSLSHVLRSVSAKSDDFYMGHSFNRGSVRYRHPVLPRDLIGDVVNSQHGNEGSVQIIVSRKGSLL
jgi:hypothetical protein